jgi:N-methylhydantoinase A/oxoprolinase/acetone carboxylase beta subunit
VVVPPASGVLSAVGLVVSERRADAVESVLLAGAELTADAVAAAVERLAERARAALGFRGDGTGEPPDGEAGRGSDEGESGDGNASPGGGEAEVRATYDLRYAGQAFELTVAGAPRPDPRALRAAFEAAHEERYGYADPDAAVELVTVRVAVALPGGDPGSTAAAADAQRAGGPAVIGLGESTLVIPAGWSGRTDGGGAWIVERER